ncbi:hypothetical protein Q3G72_013260 [Acer saccharum]|nr:hypothetical protein Q3G72_013260 [Acer saccharum]
MPLHNARLSKRTLERHISALFGDAVLLDPPRATVSEPEETKVAGDPLAQLGKGGMMAGAGRTGTDIKGRNDENSVMVTNLTEDTREPDLLELFGIFGSVSSVYVAVDQKTGMSRGFGFVNFVNKDDARRAINKLNGCGYDNLILRVEWATPRTD